MLFAIDYLSLGRKLPLPAIISVTMSNRLHQLPSIIQAPTQIVVGEHDRETTPDQAKEVFDRLTGAAEKLMTVIGGGTHSLLLENRRAALHDVVMSFLENEP